ncbi:MAG TPA: hypothetical protein VK472_01660 [Allosphingosinicella sp.]|nr:hypothetical protein [Allosphingosinicella sp.]
MALVEIRRSDGTSETAVLERVPVRSDYLFAGGKLGRVEAVVLTPGSARAAVAFVQLDPEGMPDDISREKFA